MVNIMCRLLQQNINKTFLVVQWIRIHLPMQGTQTQSLVWEDPTCHGVTKPASHNYLLSPSSRGLQATTTEPAFLEPVLRNKSSPHSEQLEKALAQH